MSDRLPFFSYTKNLKSFSRRNRRQATSFEKLLWLHVLRNDQTGYRFLRQKPLSHFILDFYCSQLKLAIEVDGHEHEENWEYDHARDASLNRLGIQVVRFTNDEVWHEIPKVREKIMLIIEKRKGELRI